MAFHTYPVERADALEDESRYRFCSREELLAAIDPDPESVVADLGSGTGFYTDDVAPYVDRLYAVDVQSEMHDRYRQKGLPDSVETITAGVDDLPLDDETIDIAYSTMTYHEYATPKALAEIRRVLTPTGRHVVIDWTATGTGEDGPPTEERFDLEMTIEQHEAAGFGTRFRSERPETFVAVHTLSSTSTSAQE